MYKRGTYGPSKFTHIGRHASGLRALINSHPAPLKNVALLGAGPVEPFAFYRILHDLRPTESCTTWAVDRDPQICQLIAALAGGEGVRLSDLSTVCKDDYRQRRAPQNIHFADKISIAVSEAERFGLSGLFSPRSGRLYVDLPEAGIDLRISQVDANEFMASRSERFDLVYMGLLLTNMRKLEGRSSVRRLLAHVRIHLAPAGILGIGASLSPRHGVHLDILDLLETGFDLAYISLENIILCEGQYYADYGMAAAVNVPKRVSLEPRQKVAQGWKTLTIRYGGTARNIAEAICEAPKHGEMVFGANRSGRERWQIWYVSQSEIRRRVIADSRLWVDFIQG